MLFRPKLMIISLVATTVLGLGITRIVAAAPPSPGQVVVNEFVAKPSSGSEWVELYNTTTSTLDIGGMKIDDIASGGGSPVTIPANTTIAPHGYYVMTSPPTLNDTTDDVRLLGSDGTTVHDTKSYSSPASGKSFCRKPDGSLWDTLQCATPTQGATNGGGSATWTPGNLEIHVLNVGQGESQLIIGPTGRTLLIGVYEANWNSDGGAELVASEIRRITGGNHVNYIMPSHWHLDHMGYATQGGIWSLLEEQGVTADAIIDRDGGVWVDSNTDGLCDPDNEVVWHNAGTVSGTGRQWVCWVTDPSTTGGAIRELADLGSTTQIDLGLGSGVVTEIVQVDADGVMQANGTTPVGGDHTAMSSPPSENDYSITVWIRWDKFDYVAAGDSDGEYATSSFGYTYNDVESVVVDRINQEIEAAWVNHHGSSHSSGSAWIDTLSPQVVAFSCGYDNEHEHPGQNVLDAYDAEGSAMYFTQTCDLSRDYHGAEFINGNIEIKVTNGVNYTVNGDPYVATDPTPPTPTPSPTPTPTPTPVPPRAPVSGEVVINEFMPAPSGGANEWVELYNTTGYTLIIGGLWIDDIAGGSSPVQIPANTTIAPYGFYVVTLSSILNNTGGDTVRFVTTSAGTTVWDSKSYTTVTSNMTYCRTTNGGSTWSGSNCTPTQGASN